MKILSIIILGLICSTSYGQVTDKDSLITSLYDDVYMKKCFDGLTQSSELDSLESKLGFRFCSIASCVNPFSVAYVKGRNRDLIKLRLEEIAERFVKDGTPIFLILGGHSGGAQADKLNAEKNEHNIRYVSTGNYCEISQTEATLENAFNLKTQTLLGLGEKKKTRRK
jgi:hypothetical protein